MIPVFTNNPLYSAWPFWVLELTPEAKNADIEKAARELSAKIKLNVPGAEQFMTPEGEKNRDEFLIREAKSKLQTPQFRLLAEYWYIEPESTAQSDLSSPSVSQKYWYRCFGIK